MNAHRLFPAAALLLLACPVARADGPSYGYVDGYALWERTQSSEHSRGWAGKVNVPLGRLLFLSGSYVETESYSYMPGTRVVADKHERDDVTLGIHSIHGSANVFG